MLGKKKKKVNFSIPFQRRENVIDLFKLIRNLLTSLKNLLFEQITLPKLSPVGDLITYCLFLRAVPFTVHAHVTPFETATE